MATPDASLDPHAVASSLRSDLSTLGQHYSSAVIDPGRRSLLSTGLAISIRVDGIEKMLLVFRDASDDYALQHLVEMLEQVQTLVIETEGRAWPACPQHHHPLDLRTKAGRIAWHCPESLHQIAWFGELHDTAASIERAPEPPD